MDQEDDIQDLVYEREIFFKKKKPPVDYIQDHLPEYNLEKNSSDLYAFWAEPM